MAHLSWLPTALSHLRAGGIVAVPTESFYALAADACSRPALERLFQLKPRDARKGIGLIVPPDETWRTLVGQVPPLADRLAREYWPGPLTLVLPAQAGLDERLVVDSCVALRVPGASEALELVTQWRGPLTATSANQTGLPPCRTASEVKDQFGQAIGDDLMVVEGEAPGGEVSSLLRVCGTEWQILREGAIGYRALASWISSASTPQ